MPATAVSDLHMVLLRAQVTGDDQIADKAMGMLSGPGALHGLAELVAAAFAIAARQKFSVPCERGQVIQFVGQVRALLRERPGLLDPVAAENEIWRALGETIPAGADPVARTSTQLILLQALVISMNLDDDAVTELLGTARMAVR